MTRFDWPALLRLGLHQLRLTPAEFWRLTPVELVLMLGEPRGGRPMDRARLDALVAAWPDKMEGNGDGSNGRTGRA
ncbi:rcc01693 family protein [Albidovulum sp.]|uniref:rcc01693 family protein n=1 Tax=Albidovulum sp. TaxID=1872424 RepID=UPI001D6298F8|nr:phage tail assembly chaperone [Paracoccaceae bacterium]MCC0046842.1 phage tail assembly chaperone [Defluviimonas sp.]HPE26251.1 phage tail assembly chaperone [Albidovulum sp.]MCB2119003.1 phage tail assembly chaperone [Paracoccaceae bacterium]MCB2123184.1 phage tail assembly chaperone [Paracoccaceae bacterium]